MTRNDDFFEQLEAYLDEFEGRTPLPDVVRHAVLGDLPKTQQVGPLAGLKRETTMRTSISTPARYGLVAVGVITAVIIGGALLYRPELGGPTPAAMPTPTPAMTPAPVPTPAPSPVPADVVKGPLNPGSVRTVTIQGIPMTFTVSGAGWETHGRPYISKSVAGPQGAEAIIYWAGFPEGMSAQPCADVIGPSVGSSAADLADAVSTAPGTELVAGPSDATLGGLPALAVVVTIRGDMGCDPGYFYSWEPFEMGALWTGTEPGDKIRAWVVDVDGTLIFVAAATHPGAGSRVEQEIQQIIGSIQFE